MQTLATAPELYTEFVKLNGPAKVLSSPSFFHLPLRTSHPRGLPPNLELHHNAQLTTDCPGGSTSGPREQRHRTRGRGGHHGAYRHRSADGCRVRRGSEGAGRRAGGACVSGALGAQPGQARRDRRRCPKGRLQHALRTLLPLPSSLLLSSRSLLLFLSLVPPLSLSLLLFGCSPLAGVFLCWSIVFS